MIRFVLGLLLLPLAAEAKTVTFGAEEVTVAVRFSAEGGKESVPTYFRFPRAIARIDNATMFAVKAASAAGTQPDYRELELRPRVSEGNQRVEVLLNDGTVVRLRLKIVANADAPVSYDFAARRVHEEPKAPITQAQGQIADLAVMRSVLQGETPAGFSNRAYGTDISCAGAGPSAKLLRVFQNDQFKVFQAEIINDSSKKSYVFREENIVFKTRDLGRSPLIHLTTSVLSPQGKGQSKAVMTILADPSANMTKTRICDLGEQIELADPKATPSAEPRRELDQ